MEGRGPNVLEFILTFKIIQYPFLLTEISHSSLIRTNETNPRLGELKPLVDRPYLNLYQLAPIRVSGYRAISKWGEKMDGTISRNGQKP